MLHRLSVQQRPAGGCSDLPQRRGLPATGQDERVHSQAHGQLGSGIQFHQRFQKFSVYAFARLIGADGLGTEQFAEAHNVPTKLLFAEGIGCDIGLLAYEISSADTLLKGSPMIPNFNSNSAVER